HDAESLRSLLNKNTAGQPVVVADGYCPSCGTAAPISEYLDCVKPFDGLVVLDDTQALGIFGHSAKGDRPYGRSGGGSLQHQGVRNGRVVLVSSLAKGFG